MNRDKNLETQVTSPSLGSPKTRKKLGSPKTPSSKDKKKSVSKKLGSSNSKSKLGSPRSKKPSTKVKEKVIKLDLLQLGMEHNIHPQTQQFQIQEEDKVDRVRVQKYIEQNQPPFMDYMTFNSPPENQVLTEELAHLEISQTRSVQMQTQGMMHEMNKIQQSPSAPQLNSCEKRGTSPQSSPSSPREDDF